MKPSRYQLRAGRPTASANYAAAVADGLTPPPGTPCRHVCHGCDDWAEIAHVGEGRVELCEACAVKAGRLKPREGGPQR